jgi:ABC-2 type transport system permease protein
MNGYRAALWAETLKARRSRLILLTAAGLLLLPCVSGLFMIILKDPERARSLGLISTKAQITVGVADWPAFFGMLAQGIAIGGAIVFALITAWIFGREFSDRTAKELLALPTPRWVIVGAKFVLIALWVLGLTVLIFGVGLAIGAAVGIPGWSLGLAQASLATLLEVALLTFLLLPFVALFASIGRGYLPALGWTILALAFANIVSFLGWGDWFPWAVPILVSGVTETYADQVGLHSVLVVLVAFLGGTAATFLWWQRADQVQ